MEKNKIIEFLSHLRNSHHTIRDIYTIGSCFHLFLMFKSLLPEAEPYYSDVDGHFIIKIENSFFDIGGELDEAYVRYKEYYHVTDEIELESSKLHKYGDKSGVGHKKYIKI